MTSRDPLPSTYPERTCANLDGRESQAESASPKQLPLVVECAQCGKEIHPTPDTPGFGVVRKTNGRRFRFCYACCTTVEISSMKKTGEARLVWNSDRREVSNVPGLLKIHAYSVRSVGKYSIAYFKFAGSIWKGTIVGDRINCKRLKRRW